HASRSSGIVTCPTKQPGELVILVVFLPAAERPIRRIRIDPDIIPVLDSKGLGVVRMNIDVTLRREGLPLIMAVDVAERAEEHRYHIGVDGHGVRAVAG